MASHSSCIFPAELHLLCHQVGRAAHQMKEWSLRFIKLSITEIKLANFSPWPVKNLKFNSPCDLIQMKAAAALLLRQDNDNVHFPLQPCTLTRGHLKGTFEPNILLAAQMLKATTESCLRLDLRFLLSKLEGILSKTINSTITQFSSILSSYVCERTDKHEFYSFWSWMLEVKQAGLR